MLEEKRLFSPGEGVMDLLGQCGLVLSPEDYQNVISGREREWRVARFSGPGRIS